MGQEEMPPMDDASSFNGMPPQEEMPMDPGMDPNAMPQEPEQEASDPIIDGIVATLQNMDDKDKKAARAYIESMAEKNGSEQQPMDAQQAPMGESYIFTKKQLKEAQKACKR